MEPLIILYIFTAKPFSLVREDKQTGNVVSVDPAANFEMSKIYQGNFQFLCHLAQLFLNTWAVILRKKSEIVEIFFFQL